MRTDAKELSTRSLQRRLMIAPLPLLAILAFLALIATPASASKTHLFQENFGSVAQPSFSRANSLAVDRSTGDLLVIDAQAKTVSRFNPDGTPHNFSALGTNVIDAKGSGQCATVPADCDQTPQNGFSFGSFAGDQQVAVDNSGTATDGNIYVTQGKQAAGNLVDIFAADGKYLGQLTAAGATKFGTTGFPFSPCGVAVDSSGNLFVAAGYENKIYKFDPTANPPVNTDNTATFTVNERVCNLAAGAGPTAGSLFVNTFFTFKEHSVLKLDSTSGALQYIVDPGENTLVSVDPTSGHLYAIGGTLNAGFSLEDYTLKEYDASGASGNLLSTTPMHHILPPQGLAVDGGKLYVDIPSSGSSGPVLVYGPLVAVPDVTTGTASITGDTSATVNGTVNPDGVALEECFFEYGPTTAYGQTAPCAESVAEIGTGPKAVHADLSGLTPEALYHYRLAAKNANATIKGSDKTFKTPSKPAIVGLWSADVGFGEATLKAQINPENSPTTYRFEYGPDASYGNSTAEIAVGSDNTDHTVGLVLNGLQPGATYHYRVIATNSIGISEAVDHAFTTFPPSPPSKADCPNQAFRTGPSANLPDCRAYEMVSPVDKNGGDIKVLGSVRDFPARLDQSSTGGERFAYSSVTAFGDAVSAPWTSQYMATRREGEEWSTKAISPPRESTSLTDNSYGKFDVQFKAFSADLSGGWLIHDTEPALDGCAVPGVPNLYRHDNVSGGYEALTTAKPLTGAASQYLPELQGLSTDGSHAVFRANAKLTENAANNTGYQLYEHVKGEGCGELRLVSVLPNGTASPLQSSAGTGGPSPGESRDGTVAHAVSADGSRIFWTPGPTTTGAGPLYVRIDGQETVRISIADAQFWTAAADGSKAIYTVGKNLYEFDVETKTSTLIAEGTKGVAGASEDASRIYFVSEDALGGEGEAGKPNLYLHEGGGASSLVATLNGGGPTFSGGDLGPNFILFGFAVAQRAPISNGVRVTADGSHLAFVSTESLTGYDNTDAVDGRPDLEIYLYDAETGKLACVSCNPSGARPTGRAFGPQDGIVRRVAAQMPPGENQLFAPRVLSEDGNRLFFESFEALLPRDTNGQADVYEWQRAASQEECEERGAELFVPSAGGCLSLISTGQSPSDSEIADASPDGSNVFIRTASSLLPQDPGQVDVYDARVNGGLPQPPSPPAACEGEACQGPLAPPNDPTPASAAFQGAGNVKKKPKARCAKGKARRKGRCVAKKHRKRAQRASHKRRAQR
ncbi:MAG: hypothetical protein WA862_09885 [Solirubrobacterales bacterium]